MPGAGAGRAAPRAPGRRGGRGARRTRRRVGAAGGRVRGRATSTLDDLRDYVVAELPREWAPRQVVTARRPAAAVQRQGRPAAAAGRSHEGLLDPAAHPLPRDHRARGRAGARAPAGWGEFSPFLEYDAATSAPWLACAREAADVGWPAPLRWSVPVNVTVPAVLAGAGARDRARLRGLPDRQGQGRRGRASSRARTRPGSRRSATRSVPTGWSGSTSTAAGRSTRRSRGSRCWSGRPGDWSTSSSRSPRSRTWPSSGVGSTVPIAADESIRRAADPYRVRDLEAADIAVLKVQPLGGVRACLRIAEDIGLPVVVSSAVESSVGIAAGVALAAALPELPLRVRARDRAAAHRRRGGRPVAAGRRRPARTTADGRPGARWSSWPPRRSGRSTGAAGWPRSRPCGRIVARDAPRRNSPPGWSTSSWSAG